MIKEPFDKAGTEEDEPEGLSHEELAMLAVMKRHKGGKMNKAVLLVESQQLLETAEAFSSQSLSARYRTINVPEEEYLALFRKTMHEYGEGKVQLADLKWFEKPSVRLQ